MLKKGFEIFRKKTTIYDVDKLGQVYGILLPPIFKLFLNHFDICADMFGEWDSLTGVKPRGCYWHPKFECWEGFTYLSFKSEDKDIFIDQFADSIPELFAYWHHDRFDIRTEIELLKIFVIGGGGLFVGVQEGYKDAIFLVSESVAYPKKIANNIFEFIDTLEQQIMSEELLSIRGVSLDKFYQNWGEDFWRIREE
jgi:hypothetical protein